MAGNNKFDLEVFRRCLIVCFLLLLLLFFEKINAKERIINEEDIYFNNSITFVERPLISNDTVGLFSYGFEETWIKIQIEGRTPNKIYGTMQHEIGHYVWYDCLNHIKKDIYRNIWDDKNCVFDNEEIEESFAYSYSCYMTPACKLCKEKDKYFAEIKNMILECNS